eukprot:2005463-Rhodomonas_salina.2
MVTEQQRGTTAAAAPYSCSGRGRASRDGQEWSVHTGQSSAQHRFCSQLFCRRQSHRSWYTASGSERVWSSSVGGLPGSGRCTEQRGRTPSSAHVLTTHCTTSAAAVCLGSSARPSPYPSPMSYQRIVTSASDAVLF